MSDNYFKVYGTLVHKGVIGKNGSLTGYGGGLERKAWLLNFEQAQHKISRGNNS